MGNQPEGYKFYNADAKILQYCDGVNWIAMHGPGSGSGGCTMVTRPGLRPEGYIFYNTDSRVMQVCAGNVWRAMGKVGGTGSVGYIFDPEGANCTAANGGPFTVAATEATAFTAYDVWGDGTYIYSTGKSSVFVNAYTFDGADFVEVGSYTKGGYLGGTGPRQLWGDGTYLFVADDTTGVSALIFDGANFSPAGNYSAGVSRVFDVWGDGTYIYTADYGTGAVRAYSYNGASFALLDEFAAGAPSRSVWGDGNYIYANGGSNFYALSFDGANFSMIDSYPVSDGQGVWGDGTYVYAADDFYIRAFTFDGGDLTFLNDYALTLPDKIWGDGVHLFVMESGSTGVMALTFDGAAFSLSDGYVTADQPRGVWGDGIYIYTAASGSGLYALSGFECTDDGISDSCTDPDRPAGTMAYNTEYRVMQYCDGANWVPVGKLAPTERDDTPDAFGFIDQTDVALSTLIESNIVQITGLDPDASVSITGDGSPQYRVCTDGSSDANCDGSVVQNWTNAPGTIDDGRYLQLRLTSSADGTTMNNATLTVGTASGQWDVTTESIGPVGCPNVGDVCADGSIYAGDANLYVTDSTQSTGIRWKQSMGMDDINPDSLTDGQANHSNRAGNLADFPAMELCENLDRHGYQDWFLPALEELRTLYNNRGSIGGFPTVQYWTSSELSANNARYLHFLNGFDGSSTKTNISNDVRCVRRE